MTDHSRDLTPTLVTRLRAGDAEAGLLLNQIYWTKLVRFCGAYLREQSEAEDVVQDVFFRVLRSTTVPDDFRAWIYRICRNRCMDVLRSRVRRRDEEDLPPDSMLEDDVSGLLTKLVKKERGERLRRLLAGLTANQREVLLLRYAEELSRVEIAKVLEIPESYVKSRLYEGLEHLRRQQAALKD